MKGTLLMFTILLSATFLQGQSKDVELYGFGHSLIDHRPPAIPTPSDETTVLHWIHDISTFSAHTFGGGGQFGFLTSHDDLPPISQWGYDQVPSVWDDQTESFGETDINTILVTAANFIQYVSPSDPHPLDAGTTVVQATSDIFNWVSDQGNSCRYYIYANWPEMDLDEAFPPNLPSESEVLEYHDYTMGGFMEWWLEYQDQMIVEDPELETKMIPIGSIISTLLTSELVEGIPFDELYEDSAPHGRANIYFLAGMITYMAIYEEEIPAGYDPGDIIHEDIRNQLKEISEVIWDDLNAFNFSDGKSRVFFDVIDHISNETNSQLKVLPNPAHHSIILEGFEKGGDVEILNVHGQKVLSRELNVGDHKIDISGLDEGMYLILSKDDENRVEGIVRFVKM